MLKDEVLYWIWLAQKCGIASKDFPRLISRYEDPFEIYRLESDEIQGFDFIDRALKVKLAQKSLESAYSIFKYCKKNDVDIITYADKRYPERLRDIENPPVLLYCIGDLPDLNRKLCVGIVGTRNISAYGMQVTYKISYELASGGACIVSGMARGVDSVAACGALEARKSTVAVLGCGIDIVYPKENSKLHTCIKHQGAVITEYPPSEPPYPSNFPKRNRIISGLSQAVLVVEGEITSGSMITARSALKQGRDVFALPGKINESNSDGPNELIRCGVNVALSAEDILDRYSFLYYDDIDMGELNRSKKYSDFKPRFVERYGISAEPVYIDPDSNEVKDKKRADKKAVSATPPLDKAREDKSAVPDDKKEKIGAIEERLTGLDELTVRVFGMMPEGQAVSIDEVVSWGIGISEAVTALSMLEINGAIRSVPGGAYIKNEFE